MSALSEACGVKYPWRLCVEGPGAPLPQPAPWDQPFLVVGQAAGADLCLAHKDVSERHALLQWIRGRLHVLDLGSRTGILWEGRRQRTGWLDPGQSIRVGPYRLALPADEMAHVVSDDAPLPALALDIKLRGIRSVSARAEGGLAVLGSAADSDVRLLDPTVSSYHCAVVNTPGGSWIVDLLGTGGTTVNGQSLRSAPLAAGDVIAVGRSTVRVADIEGSTSPLNATAPVSSAVEVTSAPPPPQPVAGNPQPHFKSASLPPGPRPTRAPEPPRELAASAVETRPSVESAPLAAESRHEPAQRPEPEPRRLGFFAPWRRTPVPTRSAAEPSPAEIEVDAPPAPSRARRDDPAPTTSHWNSPPHYDSAPGSESESSERRNSCRYPIDGRSAEISWWTVVHGSASQYRLKLDDANGHDAPQNRTVSVSIVDVSQAGLAVLSPVSPPRGERVWLRLDQELSLDWVELVAGGTTATSDGNHLVRFSFRETCPYDLFKSLVFSAGSARL